MRFTAGLTFAISKHEGSPMGFGNLTAQRHLGEVFNVKVASPWDQRVESERLWDGAIPEADGGTLFVVRCSLIRISRHPRNENHSHDQRPPSLLLQKVQPHSSEIDHDAKVLQKALANDSER